MFFLKKKKHQVEFNILTTVHAANAVRPLEVYRFLARQVRPRQLQFIPCVEPKDFETVAPQKWDPDSLPLLGSDEALPGGMPAADPKRPGGASQHQPANRSPYRGPPNGGPRSTSR